MTTSPPLRCEAPAGWDKGHPPRPLACKKPATRRVSTKVYPVITKLWCDACWTEYRGSFLVMMTEEAVDKLFAEGFEVELLTPAGEKEKDGDQGH